MKFRLNESFPGQTDMKWEIILDYIDRDIKRPSKDELNDCRYASIHHMNSNHHESSNNLMLIPTSIHSTITKLISKAQRKDTVTPNDIISTQVSIGYIESNRNYFEAIDSDYGIIFVWKPYLYTSDEKLRQDVKLYPGGLSAAIEEVKSGVESDQLSFEI